MLRAPNTTGILKGVNALKRTKKEQHDARFIFLMLFPALLVPICMTYYPMFIYAIRDICPAVCTKSHDFSFL